MNQRFETLFNGASRSVNLSVCLALKYLALREDSAQVGHGVTIVGHGTHVALGNHALHVLARIGDIDVPGTVDR